MTLLKRIKAKARDLLFLDHVIVKRNYAQRVGLPLDLSNPRGLHEKICWIKLYAMTPLHTFCTDKIMANAYVDSVLGDGHTAMRYLATYDLPKLDPSRVPSRSCVVKANHDYNSVFIIPDVAQHDWMELRKTIGQRLARNFYLAQRERQYRTIRPGALIEEMLQSSDGGPVPELKVFCFGGRVEFIALIVEGIQNKKSQRSFVDRNWNVLNVNRLRSPFVQGTTPRPACLEQIITMAEKLAEPFSFVRVDFFLVDGRPVVGELTFTPTAGYDRYIPDEFELAMGALLDHRRQTIDWRGRLSAARARVPEVAKLT